MQDWLKQFDKPEKTYRPIPFWSWNDNTFDASPYIREGKNRIEIELTIGNRNLLGPHHMPEYEKWEWGPRIFCR